MNNQPLVSLIINNYNYEDFLKKAIDSSLNQTYQNIEVIVVDDGSTDGSRKIIESYGNRISPYFKENGGQPSAMNLGFAKSSGDIICLLDSDDSFEKNKAEEIVNIFNSYPDIGWCFHSLMLVEQDKAKPLAMSRVFPNKEKDCSQKCDFRARLKKGSLGFYAPSTSGLCFTRSNLERIFPLPELLGNSVDRYIAYAAMSIDKGYYLAKGLTTQLIHENNNITRQENEIANRRRTFYAIVSAYYLQSHFPEIKWFSHRAFSRGLAMSWQHGLPSMDQKRFINEYFDSVPIFERMIIMLAAIFRFLPLKKYLRNTSAYFEISRSH